MITPLALLLWGTVAAVAVGAFVLAHQVVGRLARAIGGAL